MYLRSAHKHESWNRLGTSQSHRSGEHHGDVRVPTVADVEKKVEIPDTNHKINSGDRAMPQNLAEIEENCAVRTTRTRAAS